MGLFLNVISEPSGTFTLMRLRPSSPRFIHPIRKTVEPVEQTVPSVTVVSISGDLLIVWTEQTMPHYHK